MTPAHLLSILLGLTLAACLIHGGRRRRRREAVRRLAADWRMNFGRGDTLGLTARVARQFPVPGAAALRVYDVIYGATGDAYRYVFTAEYTAGVTGGKRRHTRVAALAEPRDRRRGGRSELVLGEEGTPLLAQYAALAPGGSSGRGGGADLVKPGDAPFVAVVESNPD